MSKRSNELPEEVIKSLRRIVTFTGNEDAVDKDPIKVLSMLLYGIETHATLASGGSFRFVIRKYCSAEGIARYSRWLKERLVA